MNEPDKDKQGEYWPFFGYCPTQKIKKFWDKPQIVNSTILIQGYLNRIGKKNKKPKQYYFHLYSNFVLAYFKKQDDTTPKGTINIQQHMLIKRTKSTLKSNEIDTLQFQKSQLISYTLYSVSQQSIDEWHQLMIKTCTFNNFSELYGLHEALGQGSFATVFRVTRKTDNKVFAAKTYFKEIFDKNPHKEKFMTMVKNEYICLKQMNHPGILNVFEMFQMPEKIVLIMEFVEGGDLYQLIKTIKKFKEKEAAVITYKIIDALNTLHKAGFVHRDLKLENIMMINKLSKEKEVKDMNIEYQIKLVDFGFAEIINEKELKSKAGTPGYIAPEVFKGQPYLAKGDIFSIGVILYCLITGQSPFRGRDYKKIVEENKQCKIDFDKNIWNEVSPECKKIVARMLDPLPKQRINGHDILKDDWMLNNVPNLQLLQSKHEHDMYKSSKSLKSIKSMKQSRHENNDENSDEEEDEDDNQSGFTVYQKDLKSFYCRNSNFTIKSFKSKKSKTKSQTVEKDKPDKGKNDLLESIGKGQQSLIYIRDEDLIVEESEPSLTRANLYFLQTSTATFNIRKIKIKKKKI